jgi:hypothetical protein
MEGARNAQSLQNKGVKFTGVAGEIDGREADVDEGVGVGCGCGDLLAGVCADGRSRESECKTDTADS